MTREEKWEFIQKHPDVKIITKYNAIVSTNGHPLTEEYDHEQFFCYDLFYRNDYSVYFHDMRGWHANSFSRYDRFSKDADLEKILQYMDSVVMLISGEPNNYIIHYKLNLFTYEDETYFRMGELYYSFSHIKAIKEKN